MKSNIVFLGTPNIAASALESLINNDSLNIVAVVTGVDKKIGRNHSELQESPVAILASKHRIKTIKTSNINDDIEQLKELGDIDILLTCAFGQFLSKDVLSIPKLLSLNVHGSLLPDGRGGAPIHWSIIKGKIATGISIMEMVKKMDAGDYFVQDMIEINDDDTYDSLYIKMSELIKKVTATRVLEIIENKYKPIKQDKDLVTFWMNITKEDTIINFKQTANEVRNQIRGLNSKPGATIIHNGSTIKVHESELYNEPVQMKVYSIGEVIKVTEKGILVACEKDMILITKITLAGKKPTYIYDIINGNIPIKEGDVLNN